MRFFYMHPDDLRWLGRWLRSNLLCIVAILCFLMMIRLLTSAPPIIADCGIMLENPGEARCEQPAEQCEPEPADRFQAVAPEGWRLTSTGWEDVSTWPPLPQSLGDIVVSQRESEPAWFQVTLAKVRGIPPLIFALMQLTAIAAIVNTARNR